jgi:hypothetical protein
MVRGRGLLNLSLAVAAIAGLGAGYPLARVGMAPGWAFGLMLLAAFLAWVGFVAVVTKLGR